MWAHMPTNTRTDKCFPECTLSSLHVCLYWYVHSAHAHACLPHIHLIHVSARTHCHTRHCTPHSNLSHWIIFSVAFITRSPSHHYTILLLSLHASFRLALICLSSPFLDFFFFGFYTLSFSFLLFVGPPTITAFPPSPCNPPPLSGWVPCYLTTLSWSSKRHCSWVCGFRVSPVFLLLSLCLCLFTSSPPHFTTLIFFCLLSHLISHPS